MGPLAWPPQTATDAQPLLSWIAGSTFQLRTRDRAVSVPVAKGKSKPKADARKREHYQSDGSYARRLKERSDRDEAESGEDERDTNDRARARAGRNSRWWLLKGRDLTNALVGWGERLKARQRRQALLDTVWEAIYKDTPVGLLADGSPGAAYLRTQQARQNIAQSMVDTVTARIVKRRPMPCISADDAAYSEKRFARKASRVLRRKMGQSIVDRYAPNVARDGVIRGTGCMKTFRDGGDVSVERVPRREILVDPMEAQYGTPRVMAQLKRVDRDVLLAMYPDRCDDIERAARASRDEWLSFEDATDADQVEVWEGWHLPSVPGAEDGCHAICIRGYEPLYQEAWTRPRFPIAFFHWSQPIDGFWGSGLVEALAPIQQEINGILRDMGEGISLGMQLKIFSPRGSNVNKNHLRARNPAVIEHDGARPEYVAPLPFNPAVLQYLQWRIQQAYEVSGISQASAASKNPLGNDASGKALDTMYDLESDRFSHVELQYAMFRVDLGHCILDEARSIAEDKDLAAKDKSPWIKDLDWTKIEIDGGAYHLILEPVNFLPDSRAGKLSTVNEMSKAGLLTDPMQTAALFDEPDIQKANRHLLGPYRMLEKWCDDLSSIEVPLEELTPTPLICAYMPLAKSMCQGELANAIADGADDEEQGRFRWALQMLEASAGGVGAAPPMGAPPQPGGADPNAPGAPPMPGAMPPMQGDPMGGIAAQAAAGMPVLPPGVS